MSSKGIWCSKADIMQDLAKVTGRLDDVDEECIVFGKKPPPLHRFEEDDNELEYRFGCGVADNNNSEVTPDLHGIMQMLRMVNNFDDTEESDDVLEPGVQEVVTISKLNPDVPEFVPMCTTSSLDSKAKVDSVEISETSERRISDERKIQDSGNQDGCMEPKETKKKSESRNDINIDKRIDVTKLNPDEIMDSIEKLKTKISKNQGCRRQKNVAIATLLKLYSAAPNSSQSVSPTPTQTSNGIKSLSPELKRQPLLFTPEYFETRCANGMSKTTSAEQDIKCTIKIDVPSMMKTDKENSQTTLDVGTSSSAEISSTNDSCEKSSVEELKSDPQVRESIRKVNKWLEKPTSPKPKEATVSLKPISFRKKENSKSPSIANSESSTPKQQKKQTAEFRPSKYAEDLSKKFMERSKALEQQNQDMWTRVQNEMKAKEEKIKQQKIEQSSGNSETSNNDNSNEGSR